MLSFPTSTVFERRIPKQKFYQNLDVTAEVKRLFIEQIKLITWANKLSAQTMNLAPGQTVQEIEVFRIRMAGDVLDSRVLNLMDKQIPYHLLFVLERSDGKCQLSVTYKEASQSGGSAFQLRQNYRTVWQTPEALTLNLTGLNMDALYEGIVRRCPGRAKGGDLAGGCGAGPGVGEAAKADRPAEKPDAQGKAAGEADGDQERDTEIGEWS